MNLYDNYTPMMRQYLKIKENYKDSLLFFRLGDFYEMFFNDALISSRELEITLTSKSAGSNEKVPMCGVPHHSAEQYIEKLIEKGYKVALCEQVEDASIAKGLVKREVVRVITPGTKINLTSVDNNFLVSVDNFGVNFVLTYCDLSTGEIYITEISNDIDILASEIISLKTKEIIVSNSFKSNYITELTNNYNILVSYSNETNIPNHLIHLLNGIDNNNLKVSFGRLLNYILNTQKRELLHLQPVLTYKSNEYLHIDVYSSRNLELTETLRTNNKKGSLTWLLDRCVTAMGSRNLKKWISKPLINENKIIKRQNIVEILILKYIEHEELINNLKSIYDIERIIGKISYGNVNAKDLFQLKKTISAIPDIKKILTSINDISLNELNNNIKDFSDLYNMLDEALIDNPPLSIKEGSIIKDNFNDELFKYKDALNNGNIWIKELERKEKNETGIQTLKISKNKIFGYYIEITKSHLSKISNIDRYIRKQTLSNCERFITPKLKEIEKNIVQAYEKSIKLEFDIFIELREKCKKYITDLQRTSKYLASLDTLQSYAKVSRENNYTRPIFRKNCVNIIDSRHPIAEKISNETFIKNNILFDKNRKILLLTGPNMSGKSTYMRQLALIIILSQIGCFVPAKTAEVKLFENIFTRIGSADDLVGGKSTFMVEMIETNNAIRNSNDNSLILFDEIGRGTSTYDGISIAQAIIEYIHNNDKGFMIFSTHYHELTDLENNLNTLRNIHVNAKKENNNIIFMHKVKEGYSKHSYGINVAALAKLPNEIINRASKLLKKYEINQNTNTFDLFNIPSYDDEVSKISEIEQQIIDIDINNITPIDALSFLNKLKNKVNK